MEKESAYIYSHKYVYDHRRVLYLLWDDNSKTLSWCANSDGNLVVFTISNFLQISIFAKFFSFKVTIRALLNLQLVFRFKKINYCNAVKVKVCNFFSLLVTRSSLRFELAIAWNSLPGHSQSIWYMIRYIWDMIRYVWYNCTALLFYAFQLDQKFTHRYTWRRSFRQNYRDQHLWL